MIEDRRYERGVFPEQTQTITTQPLSIGVLMVKNPSTRQVAVFDAVKVIEDIELPERVNQAIEHLFRMVKPGGKFIISEELWESVKSQPSLRGLYYSNKFVKDEGFLTFFVN